ncbi:MAG: hypothetical protein ACT4OU_04370 [Hyphomicrobium sp.]
MSRLARFMVAVFASVALLGHGLAQTVVVHAHDAYDGFGMEVAMLASQQQHGHAHDHDDHAEDATALISGDAASTCGASDCDSSNHADGEEIHFHVQCCGSFAAVAPADAAPKLLSVGLLDQPVLSSAVRTGSMLYPLLRPPRSAA